MKRSSKFFAFVLVLAMLVSAMPVFGSAASSLDGKTIVCFGDSLTEGTYYWETNGYPVYSDYLAESFPNSDIINAGARGDSTYNALLRYENDVIAKNPDIVIMCFGMNDQAWEVQYDRPIQTLEKYISQLTTMITDIQESGADVVLVTPNPVYETAYTPTSTNNYEYGLMPQYCDAMRKLAVSLGCGLVDINYEITERGISTYVSSDGIHQTTAGHQLYADCITAYLKAAYDGTDKAAMTVNYRTEKGNKVGSFELIGAVGAKVTVPVPVLEGHSAVSTDIKTAFVNGAEHDLTYSSVLETRVDAADAAVAYNYSKSVIDEVRALYAEAQKMLSPDNEIYTAEDMSKLAEELRMALLATGENSIIKSLYASYDTTDPNYYFQGDTRYFDDNIRLTDGVKGPLNGENTGGNNYYSAWSGDADITVDLGEVTVTNVYNAYVATASSWGIERPLLIVSYSTDGTKFTTVSDSCTSSKYGSAGDWDIYLMTVESETEIAARYIRFTFDSANNYVWVNEVQAFCDVKPIKDIAYINGVNSSIVEADAQIFTSDFGNLSTANLRYTANLVAEWDDAQNAYIVTEVFEGDGEAVDRVLEDNEILVAVYSNGTVASSVSYNIIAGATEGQILCLDGIDIENRKVSPLAYVYLKDASASVLLGDVNQDGIIDMFDYLLVKSFYFEVAVPDADEALRADMNEDGIIDMFDYLMVKTAYFQS